MGVPALFRWLSKKYPKIISPVIEERPQEIDNGDGTTTSVPIDASKPNPNGEELDNLYLDMNGIVHPCSHPEDRPPPATEEEMMIAVFEYTERVVNMVRPRKLLMIAVDGVAPRAKMNQQRSRRFRSAQEAADKDKQTAEVHAMMKASGKLDEDEADGQAEAPQKTWDSNSITPGTPFMDMLAASLRYWVSYKSSTDASWANLKIIISDATVPGEGEHKIMNFVRSQRSSPTHDPNTRHVIYGLDADLIMLGIATHEPHFRVLREDVFANDTKPGHCRKCNQPGHMAAECMGKPKEEDAVEKPPKPFIWLHVSVLREYLAVEMHVPSQPFRFDLERALDDWVFMCFFVGNDFLPHLPSLDIREDGIDTLIAIWRDNVAAMGGYVTKDGHLDLVRCQVILEGLAQQEDAIFERRRQAEVKKEANIRRRAEQDERRNASKRMRFSNGNSDGTPTGYDETVIRRGPRGGIIRGEAPPDINALPTFAPDQAQTRNDPRYAKTNLTHADIVSGKNADNKSAAAALKEKLKKPDTKNDADLPDTMKDADVDFLTQDANGSARDDGSRSALGKRTREMVDDASANDITAAPSTPGRNTPNKELADPIGHGAGASGALGGNSKNDEAMPEDTVKLWEEGYQGRYYEQKFRVDRKNTEFRHEVARAYVEGLCWVLLYYFQGCPSWTWYYPYHYAPFGADFKDLDKMQVNFHKGSPFRPYEQLMGVMPAASNHTIPEVFHPLMTDDDSPIKEFYPEDFEVDLNGKKFAWQGVALLPFIDEKRLLDAMGAKYPQLTEDEIRRNAFGNDVLIFSTRHPLYDEVARNFYSKKPTPKFKLDSKVSHGLAGKISPDDTFTPNSELAFPLQSGAQDTFTGLDENEAVSVHYHMPPAPSAPHKSTLLPGVSMGTPVLDYKDVSMTRERANRSGRSHGGVQLSQNGDRSDGRRMNYGQQPGRGNYQGGRDYQGGGRDYQGGGGAYQGQAANAFASLPPHLAQQAQAHGFPPPPMGMPPQPGQPPRHPSGFPPGYAQAPPRGGGYDGYGGYDGRQGGQGPPRGRGGGYGGQQGGWRDGYAYQDPGRDGGHGGYGGHQGGGRQRYY